MVLLVHALDQIEYFEFFFSPANARTFKYFGFEWVKALDSYWAVECLKALLVGSALTVIFGVCFKPGLSLYTVAYLYLFLLDETFYNNHYYLLLLINCLLLFTKAGAVFNLKHLLTRDSKTVLVPRWNYLLITFQVVLVYLFGGLAKLNIAWFAGEPIRSFFHNSSSVKWPFVGFVQSDAFVLFVSYAGFCIDFFVPFLLLHKKTIIPGSVILVAFHLSNSRLFYIGIFPLMGAILLIPFYYLFFCSPEKRTQMSEPRQKVTLMLLAIYFLFQVAIPLRFLVVNPQTYWSEVGQKFAWRMMHRYKDVYVFFVVEPVEAEKWLETHPALKPKLSPRHNSSMKKHPAMLIQYVQWLDELLTENGHPDTKIRAICVASVNQRKYQLLVDPNVDLTEAKFSPWKVPDWIVPLDAPAKPIYDIRNFSKRDRSLAIIEVLENQIAKDPSSRSDFEEVIGLLTEEMQAEAAKP